MAATCYTGCWYDRLPASYVKIGVSRGTPRGSTSVNIRQLNPGPWFRTAGTEEYRSLYVTILAGLDPEDIVQRIDKAACGQIPVLCCYERFGSGDFCHRAYISAWLVATLGLVVPEFSDPEKAYGGDHSMLPAEYRARNI